MLGIRRLFALAACLLMIAGCGGDPQTPSAEPPVAAAGGDQPRVYDIRGVVRRLPGDDGQIRIWHEAVPDFAALGGRVTGMDSMTMPFEVSPEVDLGELAPGDKVRFLLDVDWNRSASVLITEIEKLPPETELQLTDG